MRKWAMEAAPARALFLGMLVVGLPAPSVAQDAGEAGEYESEQAGLDTSYGYIRTIEGSATLVETDTGERGPAELNEPLLVGDRLELNKGALVELVLPDESIVRLADRAELSIDALALSPDGDDSGTTLGLDRGTLQFVVPSEPGPYPPFINTPNTGVEIRESGSYLIIVRADDHTSVIAREGRATLRTDGGTVEVGGNQEVTVRGRTQPSFDLARASGLDEVEEWGYSLEQYAGDSRDEYVDESLDYAASTFQGYGHWLIVGGQRVWQPYVDSEWRPYTNGRWRHTSSGLFWVSYEPWGWVPHHYGTWDYVDGYGWLWYPGHRFSTAWVAWYWGPSYVGWTPVGYYRHYHGGGHGYYYRAGYGYRRSFLGFVAGSALHYALWSFVGHDHLGHRNLRHHLRSGRDLSRTYPRLGRGIVTTRTRGLTRRRARHPRDAITVLASADRRSGGRDRGTARGRRSGGRDRGTARDRRSGGRDRGTAIDRILDRDRGAARDRGTTRDRTGARDRTGDRGRAGDRSRTRDRSRDRTRSRDGADGRDRNRDGAGTGSSLSEPMINPRPRVPRVRETASGSGGGRSGGRARGRQTRTPNVTPRLPATQKVRVVERDRTSRSRAKPVGARPSRETRSRAKPSRGKSTSSKPRLRSRPQGRASAATAGRRSRSRGSAGRSIRSPRSGSVRSRGNRSGRAASRSPGRGRSSGRGGRARAN